MSHLQPRAKPPPGSRGHVRSLNRRPQPEVGAPGLPAPVSRRGIRPAKTGQGGVLVHLYEKLAQHRGQLEGCRELVLLTGWAPR